MPFSMPSFPILTPDQANPYQYGLQQAIQRQLQMSQSRNYNASAAAQEAKNPYVGQREMEALIADQLKNKYTPEDMETTFASRRASTRGTNLDNRQKELEYNNPTLKYGSQLQKDIALRFLADKGGAPAVQAHQFIQSNYPDAPIEQTVAMALQAAQMQPGLLQQPKKTITQSIADQFMQQPRQQALQQTPQVPQMSELSQSLNNVLNPPQPQQAQQVQLQQPVSQLAMMDRALNADLAEKEAKAKYYGQGGGKGGGVKIQNMNKVAEVIDKIMPEASDQEKSEMFDALIDDKKETTSGKPVLPSTGELGQALLNVQLGNVPAAMQKQYLDADMLVEDLNNFPIDDLAALTGPKGRLRLLEAKAQMAINPDDPNIDPVARRYLTAVNQTTMTMDKLRSAWKTSVQPKYVQTTIGKLTNPNDSIWLDSTQVKKNFNTFKDAMNRDRNILRYKVRHGVTAEVPKELQEISETNVGSSSGESNEVDYERVNGVLVPKKKGKS